MGTAGSEDVSPSLWIQSCYTHMLFHPCNQPGEVPRRLLLDSSLGKTNLWEDRIILYHSKSGFKVFLLCLEKVIIFFQ